MSISRQLSMRRSIYRSMLRIPVVFSGVPLHVSSELWMPARNGKMQFFRLEGV